jgi:hypothetical protein
MDDWFLRNADQFDNENRSTSISTALVVVPTIGNAELDAIAVRQERALNFRLYKEFAAESRKEWLVHKLLGAGDAVIGTADQSSAALSCMLRLSAED